MISLLVLILVSQPATAGDIAGQASVIDGDTLEIRGQRIRLFGIDAPESAQNCEDDKGHMYRCGQAAANALAEMIGARTVRCALRSTDRYGRAVALCRAGHEDVTKWLVRRGLAIDYPQLSKGAYAAAQAAAEMKISGMWRGPFVEPWLFRACSDG